uniref:Hairy enhancer of split 10 n=1 Tax=Platynereis dumerilii TaxID=6359 RepID=S5TPZ6_PLADU|nr:hairy enhancer of split 10 [Platynereis dumerilii]
MKTYTSPERKLKKVMVEKRRRTRIDRALVQMKNMVLEALHVQPEKYAKMEKADILDLTVRFLRRVRQERQTAVTGPDPRSMYPAAAAAAAAMYPGYPPAAPSTSTSAGNPYPFKMAPLRPIPTTLSGHPYAHIGNLPRGPYRPSASPRFNPLKAAVTAAENAAHVTSQLASNMASNMASQLPSMASHVAGMTSLQAAPHKSAVPTAPRRVPTATVTSSEVAEASSTSRGPDSPHHDVVVPKPSRIPSPPKASSPCSTVTSSSEHHKADSNNNNSERQSAMPMPSTSRQTSEASTSDRPQSEGRRHQIEAPIPIRVMKFDHGPEFPLFGPGMWRPWFV